MRKKVMLLICLATAMGLISVDSALARQKQTKVPERRQFKPKEVKMDMDKDGVVDRVETYDEKGMIVGIQTDTAGDGKINEWLYYKGGILIKAEKDNNANGKVDTIIIYDKKGAVLKSESDTSGDGKIDEWVYYEKGNPVKAEKDTDGDGRPDTWIKY